MSDVRFYHLRTRAFADALPAILQKALAGGRRAVVRLPDEESVQHYDDHLWTYAPESFLPHGTSADPRAAEQPVFLTTGEDNPANADVLVLFGHYGIPDDVGSYALCCDFLDGNDDTAVADARLRWKSYKEAGHAVTYWQQTESGGWEQKA